MCAGLHVSVWADHATERAACTAKHTNQMGRMHASLRKRVRGAIDNLQKWLSGLAVHQHSSACCLRLLLRRCWHSSLAPVSLLSTLLHSMQRCKPSGASTSCLSILIHLICGVLGYLIDSFLLPFAD